MVCDAELLAKFFSTFRTNVSPMSSIAQCRLFGNHLLIVGRLHSWKSEIPVIDMSKDWRMLAHWWIISFFSLWRCGPTRAMASSFTRFLDNTQRRITVCRTPLDEWSARRRDLYLTTHNTHNRQISMPPVGFEPTISAGERPQKYALDRAVTGTGSG